MQGGDSPLYFAVMYARGDVVEKRRDEAIVWFSRAAEQGSLRAKDYLKR